MLLKFRVRGASNAGDHEPADREPVGRGIPCGTLGRHVARNGDDGKREELPDGDLHVLAHRQCHQPAAGARAVQVSV